MRPPKRRKQVPPRKKFYIICEGGRTEPEYFEALRRKFKSSLIELVVEPAAGVPVTIYNKAKKRKKDVRSSKNHFARQDEVWIVLDRDDHDNFDFVINSCEPAGIKVAFSNPCFELWLLLHVSPFDRPLDRHAVQQELAKCRPEYNPDTRKTANFAELLENLDSAEVRACRQLKCREEEGSKHGPPATTVFRLTRAIKAEASPIFSRLKRV